HGGSSTGCSAAKQAGRRPKLGAQIQVFNDSKFARLKIKSRASGALYSIRGFRNHFIASFGDYIRLD
ncbi:MAG: hypothetical protein KDD43_02605, partial [Bdellovibrionales bacterium]|nr:hypothetical protein [Bdellovibrionales bacterium]